MRTTSTVNAPVPLVGRDAELAALSTRLLDQDVRLITVTGQVGVGKSRLVAALFDQVRDQFADGGAYLDLADTDLAALDGLRDRHFLLALDGGDDLRDDIWDDLPAALAALVTACPKVTVLVASPARLGVYGEAVVRLAPLKLPEPAADLAALARVPSVRLFVERTQATRPDFTLTDANRCAVVELCVRSDGLPLAIELLAAGMELSSPQRLLTELDRDLGCLVGNESATLSRHHSLTAAIEWGLDRLTAAERDLLARLSVFTSHFDSPAATAVGGAPGLLAGLVDKNLLSTTECQDGDLIFRMPGPTRRHLVQHLADTDEHRAARRAHADYFLGMADEAYTALRGPEQARWLELLDAWHPDIEAALTHFAETGDEAGLTRLAASLRDHWLAGRADEGMRWLTTPARLTPRGAEALGDLLLDAGQPEDAQRRFTEAAAGYRELGDDTGTARCERGLGAVADQNSALKRRRRVEHPLTNREFEVAQLVACGMTNREVARKLGIAEWTAVNHLRKIMRKLECSSRVQVASWMTTLDR